MHTTKPDTDQTDSVHTTKPDTDQTDSVHTTKPDTDQTDSVHTTKPDTDQTDSVHTTKPDTDQTDSVHTTKPDTDQYSVHSPTQYMRLPNYNQTHTHRNSARMHLCHCWHGQCLLLDLCNSLRAQMHPRAVTFF